MNFRANLKSTDAKEVLLFFQLLHRSHLLWAPQKFHFKSNINYNQ